MNTYAGLHARHYDVVYRDKPYTEEARFVDSLLRDCGIARGRLLDLACGTGRHASEFSSLGWQVTGVDISEALLEHARINAPAASFVRQDMRNLDLPGERFEAVTCLFDAIGYALTDEGVMATLEAVARHLVDDGGVVLEFLHAPALLSNASPLRIRRFELSDQGHELVRISTTRLDPDQRLMEVEYELLELRGDGTYERWLETQANRFFELPEMERLLDRAGLEDHRLVPAYRGGDRIDADTFHVIAFGRRSR